MPTRADGPTEAQQAAITHLGSPLLLAGGSGSGRTRTLELRFRHLVDDGAAPDRVLLLTPSPPAAAALCARLEATLTQPFEELWVESLAGFCERLLRSEALEAGLEPFFSAASAPDRVALLLERIDELPLRRHEIRGNPAPLLASFVTRIDRLKEQMVDAREFDGYAADLDECAGSDSERAAAAATVEFARVYAHHDKLLAERGALGAADLILNAFRLLRERPDVRARIVERFDHMLVDDYDEATFAQRALIRLLCGDDPEVTLTTHVDSAAAQAEIERDYPGLRTIALERSHRAPRRILDAAHAIAGGRRMKGPRGGTVRFWRCQSELAEAQQVAAEVERLIGADGTPPDEIAVLVNTIDGDGAVAASAFEERAIPARLVGSAAYFRRAEVRDALAWLRLLADPSDSGAVVRALTRPPIELRSVDIARLTQLARRRKLDMIAGIEAALETPQLSPEGRDRALAFMRIYRAAARAYEELAPDLFVHRLVERIGLRRQQVFAAQAETIERLVNIAKLSDLAREFVRREPGATARDFTRYATAVAESGLAVHEASPPALPAAVRIMSLRDAADLEADHVFLLGLTADRIPGPYRHPADLVPAPLRKDAGPEHDAAHRRALAEAMTAARRSVVLSFAESATARECPYLEAARRALDAADETYDEQLFGPGEGLHATFRMMRDELLDTVSQVGGRLGEMRLDTYLDVAQAVVRYLELLKLAALIERARAGQPLDHALAEVNDLLLQGATPEQRELFRRSALDDYLRDSTRDERRRREALAAGAEEDTLEPFIPRRGGGLMLSASDIETYRLCPLKYKFARVFRIPQEPTINQRFGILLHQVLERYHSSDGGSLDHLMHLFEASWRRAGFGDSNDDLQFRAKAIAALRRYHESTRDHAGRPAWVERSFSFRLGPHLIRGRIDRVDRLPDGSYELIDYKTGKPKTAAELREDVQLSLYQMGARESWGLDTSAQSYYYVLDGEKVPVRHSEQELERVRGTVAEIAAGISSHSFEPRPTPDICRFCDYRIVCPAAEK
jgi:DNA helicase II / ATP-dependent DNA helicase PcrA